MSAKSWPIKAVIKNGKPLVTVDAQIAGKGERRFFASKHEAEGWAQVQRVRRKNQGGESFEDRNLASFGWNVKDAIKFALTHLRRQSASVSIESAVDQLLEAKRAAGCTKRCCRDVGIHLGRLARAFEGKKIAEISTADLESFLAGLQLGPGTRNTYRRDIRTLWHFAEKRGWRRRHRPATPSAPPQSTSPLESCGPNRSPRYWPNRGTTTFWLITQSDALPD
jgi:hypothetical protein